jgi:hypothetical protein
MFDRFRCIRRRTGSSLLTILVALLATIAGCDKKVAWKGVSTDSREQGQGRGSADIREEPSHGEPR